MAIYGISLYGPPSIYGPGTGVPPPTGWFNTKTWCWDYPRFALSGVNIGYYEFEINPTSYNVYPQRDTQTYATIMNSTPTIDQPYEKLVIEMTWAYMSENMWIKIKPYARKKVDGTSDNTYFWDANFGRFSQGKVKIEDLKGEVQGGYDPPDRKNVSLKLRVSTI